MHPFSFYGDVGGNYNKGRLNDGAYTLTAIAYPDTNGGGVPGDTAHVSFTVENIYSTQVSVYPNPIQPNSIINITGEANSSVVIALLDEYHPSRKYILDDGIIDSTGTLQYPILSQDLAQGVYILSVYIDGRVIEKRMVID